jgi:hypothetical protein
MWLQPTIGTVVEVHDGTADYFVVQFDDQRDTWSFSITDAKDEFRFWKGRGRHAKPRKRGRR